MKGFSTILLLLMVGLLSILAYEIRFGTVDVDQMPEADSGQPRPIESAAVPTFSLPPVDSYAETLERPLFASDRQPHKAVPVSKQPQKQQPVRQADPKRFVLSAVVMQGDMRVALLRDATNGTLTRLKEGSSVGGWALSEVRADSVVLSRGSATQEVQLRRFEPPPPPKRKRRKARRTAKVDKVQSAKSDSESQRRRREKRAQTQRGQIDDGQGQIDEATSIVGYE